MRFVAWTIAMMLVCFGMGVPSVLAESEFAAIMGFSSDANAGDSATASSGLHAVNVILLDAFDYRDNLLDDVDLNLLAGFRFFDLETHKNDVITTYDVMIFELGAGFSMTPRMMVTFSGIMPVPMGGITGSAVVRREGEEAGMGIPWGLRGALIFRFGHLLVGPSLYRFNVDALGDTQQFSVRTIEVGWVF